ncbi:hypothetical protein [Pseudonocardia sp. HH130630-07]|uniref:hypothetical protein n=1 Tax=Pseudonocardia sp. HH130630-07 TaxID=1690815 RepID=UPI0008152D80|nr:hypothetical protein [Pseudonocardia sp. HH130630-07]ANY07023.1 hypothetical protein AFB00_12795 [Pseudonocardia sp. HH130630-07]
MQYRHAPAANHAALDAALASAPGRPTLPVRLTVELFGRAREHVPGARGTLTVWDPCCGAGGTLAVLGLLCAGVHRLAGSDADPRPLDLARRNLGLLGPGGLATRADELEELAARHGKDAYAGAAAAVRALVPRSRPEWSVGVADAGDPAAVRAALGGAVPDMVLADLPHDRQTTWSGLPPAPGAGAGAGAGRGTGGTRDAADGTPGPAARFLSAVAGVVRPDTVIVAVGAGRTVPLPPGTRSLERVRIGRRAAVLVRAGELGSP